MSKYFAVFLAAIVLCAGFCATASADTAGEIKAQVTTTVDKAVAKANLNDPENVVINGRYTDGVTIKGFNPFQKTNTFYANYQGYTFQCNIAPDNPTAPPNCSQTAAPQSAVQIIFAILIGCIIGLGVFCLFVIITDF